MKTGTKRHRSATGARSSLAAIALSGLVASTALAGPVGEQVVVGDVTFIHDGNQTIIQASDGSIISYLSFDIMPWETVQFIQPNQFARVLNRIDSAEPTQIMGTLLANGIVYFVNPSGVIFGANATIDAAGIVAAAGSISDADFLSGNDLFTDLNGSVVNHGAIDAKTVHLLGQYVANHGSITANGGTVAMVAGDSVWLRTIDGKLAVRVDGKDITGQAMPWAGATDGVGVGVENTGTITANGGQVVLGAGDVAGLAIYNAGLIRSAGGDVTLAATHGVVRNDGTINVSGNGNGDAGTVVMQGPAVFQNGVVKADAANGGAAGTIELMGRHYTILFPGSTTSAKGVSGTVAGGRIVVDTIDGVTYMANGAEMDVRGGLTGGAGGDIEVGGDGIVVQGSIKLDRGNGGQIGTFTLLGGSTDVVIGNNGDDDALIFDDGNVVLGELPGGGQVFLSVDTIGQIITGSILIQASGSVFVVADLTLVDGTDLTLEAMQDIEILAAIIGAGNLTATADMDGNGSGTIRIDVPLSVGGSIALAGNLVELNGGMLTAGDAITIDGAVQLLQDTVMNAGGDVTFLSTVDSAFNEPSDGDGGGGGFAASLTVNTQGTTTFGDTVGGNAALADLTTDAGGTTRVAADVTADRIFMNDQVVLDDSVTMTGTTRVHLVGGLEGNGNDLTILSPRTRFEGGFTGLGRLETDADGTTRIGGSFEANEIVFMDDVQLIGASDLFGAEIVYFGGDIFGTNDLVIESDQLVQFEGDLGTVFDPLKSLVIRVDASGQILDQNLIVFGPQANQIYSLGDILLNADGRDVPAQVATIVALANGLTMVSSSGDILIGPNEKFTALGDLRLAATTGSVTFGDLTVLSDFSAEAGEDIFVWAREAGQYLTADGQLLTDGGTEIYIGGSANFTGTPIVQNVVDGAAAPIFVTVPGSGFDGLGDFEVIEGDLLSPADVTFEETVLDFGLFVEAPAPPPGPGPNPGPGGGDEGGFEGTIATLFADEIQKRQPIVVDPPVNRDPIAVRAMQQIALLVRSLSDAELATIPSGRLITVDQADPAAILGSPTPMAATRHRAEALDQVATDLERVFGPAGEDDPAEVQGVIRGALDRAWRAYAGPNGGDALGFVEFLESTDTYLSARYVVEGLREVVGSLRALGLTDGEERASIEQLIGPITPASMDRAIFEEVIFGQ